jgi:serine/threonine-protein kinase
MNQTVVQNPGDPYIYMFVQGEWYCYNPNEDRLGGGAMGTVYRGFRCKDGATVAVKRVIDNYANNRQIRERAKFEASLVFRHTNLVEMIGYCEYAPTFGPIFLISKFVSGEDIDKYVKRFANAPDRVEKISKAICQVCDALDYLHHYVVYQSDGSIAQTGIIHRDVKPSNIMVEGGSNVRLMDLGIARQNSGNSFSSFGFIGTPEYSAPEQIKGDKDSIGPTTDIYQLGVTFYELLDGTNPMACEAESQTLTKQIQEELPSSPRIPRKMLAVIRKATEKEQSSRYQSAMEFKKAIQLALMPDPSLTEQISDWVQTHLLAFLGIVVLLGIIAVIIFLILL